MDKILVHATSLNNLPKILLSGFLAHSSLAILNNEQKQSSDKFVNKFIPIISVMLLLLII